MTAWYFEQQLGRRVPDDLDDYARRLALAGKAELYILLHREYLYVTLRQLDGDEKAAE